jgi:hypothetical protein
MLLSAIVLQLGQSSTGARQSADAQALLGTWRVVSYEDRKDENDPNSEWVYPFGRNPRGYFTYDRTGHVTVQLMKMPAARFASGDDAKPTPDELRAVYDGYVAYFGTYTVNATKRIVVHHVEGSLRPGYAGTDQERPFLITGDRLIIGDQRTWRRTLERPTVLAETQVTLFIPDT